MGNGKSQVNRSSSVAFHCWKIKYSRVCHATQGERVVGEYRWKLVYTGVAQGVAQFRQELLVNARVQWLTRTAPFSNPPRNRE